MKQYEKEFKEVIKKQIEKINDENKIYENSYECNSINNKTVRFEELKTLRKIHYAGYYAFEFGRDKDHLKKRFYNNEEDFLADFENLTKIKKELSKIKK